MNKCQIFPETVTGNTPVVAKARVHVCACVCVSGESVSNSKNKIHTKRLPKFELANKGSEETKLTKFGQLNGKLN